MKRYATFILFAAILLLFLPWLGDTLFNTKGEPREAIVALSMLKSGDYILPSSFGGDIPYKPPFLAWLIVVCSRFTGGVNEISARMPSAIATVAMAVGFYLFIRRRRTDNSRDVALLSTAVLVTAFEVYRAATACRVDMVLTACVVGAILLFNRRREIDGRPGVSIFGILLMMCGVLTKGPVGMLLPCLILGIYFLWRGDKFLRAFWVLALSGILSLTGYAVWFYMAIKQGGDDFFYLMWEENFGRMTGTMSYQSHVNPWYYNLITIIAGMVPYTLAALFALFILKWKRVSFKGWWTKLNNLQPVSKLSLTAIVITLVFYTIPASKRSVYLLPLYPFLSYFTALMLLWMSQTSRRVISAFSGIMASLAVILSMAVVILKAVEINSLDLSLKPDMMAYLNALHGLSVPFAAWLCVCASYVIGWYTFVAIRRRDALKTLWWGIASIFSLYLVLSSSVLPAVLSSKSDKYLAEVVNRYVGPTETVYQYITEDMLRFYTTGFYLGDRIVPLQDKFPLHGYVMVSEKDIDDFLRVYNHDYKLSQVYESPTKSCDTRAKVRIYYFTTDLR